MKKWMMLSSVMALLAATPAFAKQETYDLDPSHTTIQFGVFHGGFSRMIGKFTKFDSTTLLDETKPENSKVSITIDPTSVKTSSEQLDEHLQKADFFNSGQFPEMKFTSTKIEKVGDNQYKLTGDFTLLAVTKPITLDVTFNKKGDFFGKPRAGFSMKGQLMRSEFGMKYGIPEILGDEVDLYIETEAVKRDVAPPQKKKD
jgi:polyisoprenoid-binding protein YceI